MTDSNLKNLKWVIAFAAVLIFFLLLFPIYYYLKIFKDVGISNNTADWGSFGDYLGGTSGLILSFFAVIFSLISIVITANIAKAVQDANRQLVNTQVKPFLNIDLINLTENTSIVLKNMGLGPMLIKKIEVTNNGLSFKNFKQVINHGHQQLNIHDTMIKYNTLPNPILSPNSSIVLLEIVPRAENNIGFKHTQNLCRALIGDYTISIEFQDIFENSFNETKALTFFKST